MLELHRDTPIPNLESCLSILRAHNRVCPNFFDYDKICMYFAHHNYYARLLEGPLRSGLGIANSPSITLANGMESFLTKSGKAHLFKQTTRGLSLAEESITQAIDSGQLTQLEVSMIEAFQRYNKMKRYARSMLTMMQLPMSGVVSKDNHKTVACTPNWRGQNTGRCAMYDPAIQNLPRELQDITTCPAGFTIIHTDSGQIDPRVTISWVYKDKQISYLINLYDDAYYAIYHYCMILSDSDISSGRTDFAKMELTDEIKEARKRIKTYVNAVVYGSTSNPTGDPVKAAMIKRLGQHPARLELIERNRYQIDRGDYIFKTYFGTPIDISKSEKLSGKVPGSKEWYTEMERLAINNPIQGTAADCMRYSVAMAHQKIAERPDSVILHYIHDAGVFMVADEDIPYLKDFLSDCVGYQIDDWIPIHAEPEYDRPAGLFADWF